MKKINRKIMIYTILIIILVLAIVAILFLRYTNKIKDNESKKDNTVLSNELYGFWNRSPNGEAYDEDNQKYTFIYSTPQYLYIEENSIKKCTQKENNDEEYDCVNYTYKMQDNNLIFKEKTSNNENIYSYEINNGILILKETKDNFTTIYSYTRANG